MKYGLDDTALNSLESIFHNYPGVEHVLIFGSRAKGNFKEGSDIDLVVKGAQLLFTDILELKVRMDDLNLPYKIDLLHYNSISDTEVRKHIDRVGKSIYPTIGEVV